MHRLGGWRLQSELLHGTIIKNILNSVNMIFKRCIDEDVNLTGAALGRRCPHVTGSGKTPPSRHRHWETPWYFGGVERKCERFTFRKHPSKWPSTF
ncbi:hypothetical protein PoB_005692900 [Plakobranchus ocellatus]|uniref:Uncharacterized protein n=1 Tax=Plakobranchus ocellatus TaxID=259542 RepID=A0AAV4CCU6_9GAST|nr:hypothetical protein PoB_005692900 [Plakobranchus ocellatus]